MSFPMLDYLQLIIVLSTSNGSLSGGGYNSVSLKGRKKKTTQTLLNVANQAFSKVRLGMQHWAVFDVIFKCCSGTVLPSIVNCITVPMERPYAPEQAPVTADLRKPSLDTGNQKEI